MDKITIRIGYIKMERNTETVDHFLTHYRSQGLPPFYRSRPRTTTYPREERQDGHKKKIGYIKMETETVDHFLTHYRTRTRTVFLEQDDQIMQDL